MTYRYSRLGRDAKGEPSGGAGSGAFSFHCCARDTIAEALPAARSAGNWRRRRSRAAGRILPGTREALSPASPESAGPREGFRDAHPARAADCCRLRCRRIAGAGEVVLYLRYCRAPSGWISNVCDVR